jgi:hypothetical protein
VATCWYFFERTGGLVQENNPLSGDCPKMYKAYCKEVEKRRGDQLLKIVEDAMKSSLMN